MMDRRWWLPFCLAVLAMRLLIPAGNMPVVDAGRFAIVVCPDAGAAPMAGMTDGDRATASRHLDAHGKRSHGDGRHDGPGDNQGGGQVCTFAGLSAPLLGGVDPVLLVAALAWVAAVALATPPPQAGRRMPYLRPPSQAPPAPAPIRR